MDPVKQVFVSGHDLKADLAKLDVYYSALPDEVKEQGVMSFAHYPPTDGGFLVTRLWDKLTAPHWRADATAPRKPRSPEMDKKLVQRLKAVSDAPRIKDRDFDFDAADTVVFHRMVPARRGKWRMLSQEVVDAANEKERSGPES